MFGLDYEDEELRKELHHLYWEQKLSIRMVAQKMSLPYSTLRELFQKFGLSRRSYKDAGKLRFKRKK